MSFLRSYVVPEGFPDSVSPSYVPFMKWRALKVIFQWNIGMMVDSYGNGELDIK